MPERPASQSLVLELVKQLTERIDGGHSRVRQSVDDLTTEVREGYEKMEERITNHTERLVKIETERAQEVRHDSRRHEDVRQRWTLIVAVASMALTLLFNASKTAFHW